MTQFPQGFRFDLADALSGDAKRTPYLFESAFAAIFHAKAHLDDPFLSGLSVFSNDAVCSSRLRLMAASEDDATALSSVCGRKYVDVGDEHHVKDT
jgi:hypothetical protein